MKRFLTASLIIGLLVLLSAAAVWAGNTETCAVFAPETRFVDREGNTLDPAVIDAMAVKELDLGTVLVYRRTAADAEALV